MSDPTQAIDTLLSLPSPLDRLNIGWADDAEVVIDIKRDDLIHPLISGNKWRKLKYNIQYAQQENCQSIITYGGAFSNHLVAVAAIGNHLGVRTVGLLRGYKIHEDNPTIKMLRSMKMDLHLIHPPDYKLKNDSDVIQGILDIYPNHYLVPEGGTNEAAVRGVAEIWDEVDIANYTHVVLGLGTAGTLAGMLNHTGQKQEVLAVSPFKEEVTELAGFEFITEQANYKIIPSQVNTRFGGYDADIVDYINDFYTKTSVLLDPIYTAKTMMTLQGLCVDGYFPKGGKVLFIHTGGLQGILGYNYLHNSKMNNPIYIPSELGILQSYE